MWVACYIFLIEQQWAASKNIMDGVSESKTCVDSALLSMSRPVKLKVGNKGCSDQIFLYNRVGRKTRKSYQIVLGLKEWEKGSKEMNSLAASSQLFLLLLEHRHATSPRTRHWLGPLGKTIALTSLIWDMPTPMTSRGWGILAIKIELWDRGSSFCLLITPFIFLIPTSDNF